MKIKDIIISESEYDVEKKLLSFLEKNKTSLNKDVIDHCFKKDIYLFRGIKTNEPYFSAFPRKDRKPKDTPIIIQSILNEIYEKNSIKATRGNSFFTTTSSSVASDYGEVYVVFPYKNFHFSYGKSEKMKDLFFDFISNKNYLPKFITKNIIPKYIKNNSDKIYQILKNLGLFAKPDSVRSLFYKYIESPVKHMMEVILSREDKEIYITPEQLIESVKLLLDIPEVGDKNIHDRKFMINCLTRFFSFIFTNQKKLFDNIKKIIQKYINEKNEISSSEIEREIYETFNILIDYIKNEMLIHLVDDHIDQLRPYEKSYEKNINTKDDDEGYFKNVLVNKDSYNFYSKLLSDDEVKKYLEKQIIKNIIYGSVPDDINLFLGLLKKQNENELLINGQCCFINYEIFEGSFYEIKKLLLS
jgi:hypothetical protein